MFIIMNLKAYNLKYRTQSLLLLITEILSYLLNRLKQKHKRPSNLSQESQENLSRFLNLQKFQKVEGC